MKGVLIFKLRAEKGQEMKVFSVLFTEASRVYRSGRAASAAPKACPVTALLVLGHRTKWPGTEFCLRFCQVLYTHPCS